jgi:ABC-type transport system involved in multi-copper enzyme maturation permease subunit
MSALLWKDYRISLLVLAFGVAVLVGLPLATGGLNLYGQLTIGSAPRPWSELLVFTTPFGLAVQLLTMAMLGGCAIAAERTDRSAEFLAYLPPSRWMIVTSKALLAIGTGLFIWSVSLVIIYVVAPHAGMVTEDLIEFRDSMVPTLAATSVLLFGAAWLGSSFMPTHTLATGFGIGVAIALLCALWAVEFFFELRGFDLGWWYRTLSIPLGIAAFVAGVVCYVRRVEP